MPSKHKKKEIESYLTCPICKHLLDRPTTICECLHTCKCDSSFLLVFSCNFMGIVVWIYDSSCTGVILIHYKVLFQHVYMSVS